MKEELTFYAISPDGEVIVATGINRFARAHKLTRQAIQNCLSGRASMHRGWKFERIEDKNSDITEWDKI